MPRELKILNGPSFRQLEHGTGIFAETGWASNFTIDGEFPSEVLSINGKSCLGLHIDMIARITKDQDEFVLHARTGGSKVLRKDDKIVLDERGGLTHVFSQYHYVIHYNARTRKGRCIEYTKEEFFSLPVTRYIFGFNQVEQAKAS